MNQESMAEPAPLVVDMDLTKGMEAGVIGDTFW